MTRMIRIARVGVLSDIAFEELDKVRYSVENKLLALIRSLQPKKKTNEWVEQIPES